MSSSDPTDESDLRLEDLPAAPGLSLIVAVGRGGAIGRSGTLAWSAPEDLAHFRNVTTGHAVIIGATTWLSIGRALPKRQLIVVTSRDLVVPDGVQIAPDPAAALRLALSIDEAPFLGGGAVIYNALLPSVVRIHCTDIDVAVPDADTFFPAPDPREWIERLAWRGTDQRLSFRVLDRA